MSASPHKHQQHRPDRLLVPVSRLYPTPSYSSPSPIPFSPSAPTPSKQRRRAFSSSSSHTSLSSIFLLLFSLRSLYSLLPFLRSSSPSFSLFPFSFLVTLLSFFLSFILSSSSASSNDSPPLPNLTSFSSPSILRPLFAKSSILALVFLLRYQALRSCGTAATILAEFSGTLAAKSLSERRAAAAQAPLRGSAALLFALLLLSLGWDQVGCLPLSLHASSLDDAGGSGRSCVRILPMLLPFLAGFLAFFERASANWGAFRPLGRRHVRLISLFLTAALLSFPAFISFLLAGGVYAAVSVGSLGWPLLNTVVFGVILSESYGDDKYTAFARDLRKDFLVTFSCTLVLELFYYEDLALFGFLFCGFLLWLAVRDLSSGSSSYAELGSDSSDTFSSMILSPLRHIFSERKSRKIALFLLINTAYMVVEFVAGFMSNSLGLISDACHMLFDCAALAIGLYASYISRLPANSRFSYGRGRFEVLSGYVNAVFLVLVGALIVLESIERILDPQEISTSSLLAVSVGGLVVNVVGLIFFHEEHHHAHGGAGTCSHSHSHHLHHHHHSHEHHHSSHEHRVHDLEHHQQANSMTYEASAGRSHILHEHGVRGFSEYQGHDHPHHSQGDQAVGSFKNHDDNDSQHDLHSHDHQCGTHDEHVHGHGHDHHVNDTHCHDHHSHSHSHSHSHRNDHDQLDKQEGCQGHGNCSGQHSNLSHGCHQHDHHDSYLGAHPHEVHGVHDNSLTHRSGCFNKDLQNLSNTSNHSNNSEHSRDSLEEKVHGQPKKHHHIDHNMEGIFLHVLADTMGSVGVVISTLLIRYKGWLVSDPACSIFISVLIVSSVIPLLRNSAEILLQRIPRAHEQELKLALDEIMSIEGIRDIQNVHVWSLTNTDVVGTLHLHVAAEIDKVSTKEKVSHILSNAGIKDLTLQVE